MGLGFPHVVISRDGSNAIQIQPWGDPHSIDFAARAEPFGYQFLVRVSCADLLDGLVLSGHGLDPNDRLARQELAAIAIGEALDNIDGVFEPPPRNEAIDLGSFEDSWALIENPRPKPADLDECLLYIGATIFWNWMFGAPGARLRRIDEIRLGLPRRDLAGRLALGGLGTWWEATIGRSGDEFRPTGNLIQAFRSGSFPGLEASPVIQVRRQLAAPRYRSALDLFEAAIANTTPPSVVPRNAATDAARAVEAMAEAVLGLKGKVTIGDVKKELVGRNHLDPAQAKYLDALGGFRGPRAHGKQKPTTPAQARLAVNSAAAMLLFLLEIDVT